jgi:hypothetical protein
MNPLGLRDLLLINNDSPDKEVSNGQSWQAAKIPIRSP